MKTCKLKKVTGKELKSWWEWLVREQAGCCSINFASTEKYRYCVCMGWHDYGEGPDEERGFTDGFRVAWKIGRQTHNNIMQCDFDIDFEMPYVTEKMVKDNPELCEGDVDDTLEEVERKKVVYKPYKCWSRTWHPWRWSVPVGYRDWNALAARIRKTARRVYRDWRDYDD